MKTPLVLLSKAVLQTTRQVPRSVSLAVLALLAAGSLARADTVPFSTPGTNDWVCPAGVSQVTVECRGGGGAGGAAIIPGSGANTRGGSGAGGSYAIKSNLTVVAGTTYKVIVGAGGFSITNGVTDYSVIPEQNGGDSAFMNSTFTTAYAKAVGGGGGTNAVCSGSVANRNGGPGSTSGCIGDKFFKGGNGSNSGGGGGGGAGDAANGGNGSTTGTGAGTGGVAGGGDGGGSLGLNNNGLAGIAPGGGGSAGQRNLTAAPRYNIGGAGGAGRVVLTYTVATGVDHYAVAASSPQTVGSAFDVTITAQDSGNVTVNDSINTVTVTSPTAGSLMEFDWNGDGTYSDNSGIVGSGVTIKARNRKAQMVTIVAASGAVTTTSPPSVTTDASAFSKLQILAPGETAAPGTTAGKTGAPSTRTAGVSFNVTVNAVDAYWNLSSSVTHTVGITSTDTAATLPLDAPLVAGTRTFAITLNTPGSFTLTATNVSDGAKSPDTTPALTVQAVSISWRGDGSLNQWDTTSLNWTNTAVVGTRVAFANLNQVTFDNNGSSTPAVDIVGTVTPWSIIVNSANNYTLGSTSGGSIGGAAGGFTKQGSGTLTLATANTYTGGTTNSGGALILNNANALPGGIGTSGGTSALTLNGGVLGLGAGDFTRGLGAGADQIHITADNSGFAAYGADRVVNLGGASAQLTWGSGGFFTSGSTLVLGHATATHTVDFQNPIVLSGTRFFRTDDGSATVDARLSGAVTGSTTFSKAGNGTLELSNTGNAWTGITYVDSGTLRLGAADVLPGNTVIVKRATAAGNTSGVLDLNGFNETIGALTLGESANDPNSPAQTPSVVNSSMTTATLTLGGNLTYAAGPANQNGQATISANLALGGNRDFTVGDGSAVEDLVVSGSISGSGNTITKKGTGTLALSGANTYSGTTTVSAGTLALSGSGSLASPQMSVSPGAKFDVSTITPAGYTLAGTLSLSLNKTGSTLTQGQVALGAKSLAYGGNLTVVSNANSEAFASGNAFTLFVTNGTPNQLSGWFSSVTLPALTSGIAWDTNKLAASGVLDVYTFTTTTFEMSTPKNTAAVIPAAKLASHASSLRGTPVAVSATTPSHGTAGVSAGVLTYTPTTGYEGGDSFTVTFSDGRGVQTMAVSVTVGSGTGGSANVISAGVVGSDFVVKFAAIPGYTYTVETNSVANGPGWTKMENITAGSDGAMQVVDPLGTGSLFYRTVWPSY